jgi:hypothetical protein
LLGLLVDLCILFGLGIPPSTTFRFEGWVQGSNGRVFFDQNTISAVRGIRIAWVWDIKEVGMLFAKKIFEERIDMHRSHPSFQSDCILLYLLHRLTFGNIWRLNSKVLSELAPCFDLLSIELDDKLPQSICLKFFVIASRWSVELSPKRARVNVEREMRVAVQNERYICICDVVRIDVLGR